MLSKVETVSLGTTALLKTTKVETCNLLVITQILYESLTIEYNSGVLHKIPTHFHHKLFKVNVPKRNFGSMQCKWFLKLQFFSV